MKKNNEFVIWFRESWMKSGGLISSSIAGKILNVSACRVNQLIKEGKVKNYPYKANKRIMPFVSLSDILSISDKKTQKNTTSIENNPIQ